MMRYATSLTVYATVIAGLLMTACSSSLSSTYRASGGREPLSPSSMPAAMAKASSPATCGDRIALLHDNLALFDARRDGVQALLIHGLNASNWRTYPARSRWGPLPTRYAQIEPPANCTDIDTFEREWVMATENYWVDQNINYCYHHIPGWIPPNDADQPYPKYRNTTRQSTFEEWSPENEAMTCTARRDISGAQSVERPRRDKPAPLGSAEVNWQGLDCSNFTSWIYNFAGLTSTTLSSAIDVQACATSETSAAPGVLLDINYHNIEAMAEYLKPGDLLYITQKNPVARGAFATDYKLAHVVTWTGKRWSDLQAGPDAARYDIARIGQPDSRLGGDFLIYLGFSPSQLGKTPATDPWMIIDSHYAGPAYRPFSGWYSSHLSHVRRIIGAQATHTDPVLADYVIKPMSDSAIQGWLMLTSAHAHAQIDRGYRLIYEMQKRPPRCYRAGEPQ